MERHETREALTAAGSDLKLGGDVAARLRPHLDDLIVSFFDEKEPSMTDFFVATAAKHRTSNGAFGEMWDNMGEVLDEDCGKFMAAVWRMMKFYQPEGAEK